LVACAQTMMYIVEHSLFFSSSCTKGTTDSAPVGPKQPALVRRGGGLGTGGAQAFSEHGNQKGRAWLDGLRKRKVPPSMFWGGAASVPPKKKEA